MDHLTVIIGRSYEQGMAWLRDNKLRKDVNPQRCRILTNPDALLGLRDYRIIYLSRWKDGAMGKEIQSRIVEARSKGRVIEEVNE